jgi:LPS-assembly protein
MKFFFLLTFTLLFSQLVSAAKQSAKIQGIQVQAESMIRDTDNEIIDLVGQVQVVFADQHLKCHSARINLRSKTIHAEGDVLVTSPQANMGGDRVLLEYESNTGLIYEGYVQSGTVIFEGSLITKISENEYLADDAKYTACTTCPETWSFSGNKIRAELGGYAYIKNSTLRFASLPAFWMPYLIVPLKSDRQTGVLSPRFSKKSDSGLIISQPFFWAISRSQDATLTVNIPEKNSIKPHLEYNYMLAEKSYGTLQGSFFSDRIFRESERLNKFRSPQDQKANFNRWYFDYTHYYELPEGYVQRAKLMNISDLQYPNDDLNQEFENYADAAIDNRISLSKNTNDEHFAIDSSYYINLLKENPIGSNEDAVQRFPEISYSRKLSKLFDSDFLFKLDVKFSNFTRSGFAYDDIEIDAATSKRKLGAVDGIFNDNIDLIRTGQRLDIKPYITRPFTLGPYLSLNPSLQLRDTYYNFNIGEKANINRKYIRAEISAKNIASQVYEISPAHIDKKDLVKHEIQSEVKYTTIPWINQPDHPFFGRAKVSEVGFAGQQFVSDSDLDLNTGLQFDYEDRLYDRKLVTFSIANLLTSKIWNERNPEYFQFLNWKLSQSFDAFQDEKGDPNKQPLTELASELRINFKRVSLLQQAYYFPFQQVTNTNTTIKLTNVRNDAISLRYANTYAISPGVEVDPKSRVENYTVVGRVYSKYVDWITYAIYNPKTSPKFQQLSNGIELKVPGDCLSLMIFHNYDSTKPKDPQSYGFNFGFVWDGQAKSNFINTLSSTAPFNL